MEELGSNQHEGINNPVRKKRSHTFRRSRPESQPNPENHELPSLSSTPPSDEVCKGSSDENAAGEARSTRKEINVNQYVARFPSVNGVHDEKPSKRSKKGDVSLDVIYSNTDLKGMSAPKDKSDSQSRFMSLNNGKSDEFNGSPAAGVDGSGNESKVKRVKLKVGGAIRTVDASATPSDKRTGKDESDKRGGLQGVPWKDFSVRSFSLVKDETSTGKTSSRNRLPKQSDSARKNRRAPKRRAVDGEFDEDEEDDEIRYLEKLRNSKLSSAHKDDDEDSEKKQRRLSNISKSPGDLADDGNVSVQSGKEGKQKSPSEDTDYEEEPAVDSAAEPKREFALTTRQRALKSGKDASASGGNVIEFPNGLPPAPSRKQREKLTDVELQLKKSEAAQRRKLQNEKAARESEAEAIRRILGQDSNRKKREDKKKKRQEELAQEKANDALMRASNTVRWTMGPNGTIVTFPTEMVPSILNSKPISYPPPREKCAGPSCTNPYKYRDSKTKLPLCSLQCYKAVQASSHLNPP